MCCVAVKCDSNFAVGWCGMMCQSWACWWSKVTKAISGISAVRSTTHFLPRSIRSIHPLLSSFHSAWVFGLHQQQLDWEDSMLLSPGNAPDGEICWFAYAAHGWYIVQFWGLHSFLCCGERRCCTKFSSGITARESGWWFGSAKTIYIYIQNSRHFNAQFSNLTVPAFVPTEGIYLLYSGYAQVRRKPVQHAVIRPAFVSGCIWSVGFLFMIKGIHELLGSTCCDAKIQQFWESWAILRPKFWPKAP